MADGGTTYRIDAEGNFSEKMAENAQWADVLDDNIKKSKVSTKDLGDEILGMVTSWSLVNEAIDLAMQSLREYQRVRQEGARETRTAADAIGALQQQASSPAEFQSLLAATGAFGEAAGIDPVSAAESVFQLASAGMMDQAGFFASLRKSGFVRDVPAMIEGIATVQANVNQAMSPAEVLAASQAAAAVSPKVTLDDVLTLSGRPLAQNQAGQLGFGVDEILSLTVTQAAAAASKEQGSTQAAALLRGLAINAGIEPGTPLMDAIRDVQSRNLSAGELQTMFGEEGIRGFTAMQSADSQSRFAASMQTIRGVSDPEAFLRDRAGFAESVPFLAEEQLRRSREAAKDFRLMNESAEVIRAETIRSGLLAEFGTAAAPVANQAFVNDLSVNAARTAISPNVAPSLFGPAAPGVAIAVELARQTQLLERLIGIAPKATPATAGP